MSYWVNSAPKGASFVDFISESANVFSSMINDSCFDLFLIERSDIKEQDFEGFTVKLSEISYGSRLMNSTGTNLRSLFSRIAETLSHWWLAPVKLSGRKNDYISPI